ncbi:MAG: hypothetical protein ABIW57_04040 [Polyangia bacterium]
MHMTMTMTMTTTTTTVLGTSTDRPGILVMRAAWVIAVVASGACSSRSLAERDGGPGGPDASMVGDVRAGSDASDAFGADDSRVDAPVTGDSAIDAPVSPPLDLPGIVLWLDGDVGIDAPGSPLMTWTDRSEYRHVFVAQSSSGEAPARAQLNGHGAVRFNGLNRFISEHTPTPTQKDALSLGSNFVVAMVFLPESSEPRRAIVARAGLPWIASPPQPEVPPFFPYFTFTVLTGVDPTADVDQYRQFQAGAGSLNVAGGFTLSPHRLILSTDGSNQVRVRLNGQLQTGEMETVPDPADGSYGPIYVGSWDFDSWGFDGTVAEMVIVRGGADPATEEVLDSYLKGKFSL